MAKPKTYEDIPPLTTWQFFHACRVVLGKSFLQKVFKRSLRQIYRWSANPQFCEEVERNPIDCLKIVIDRLKEIGRDDIAYAGLQILADSIDCDLVPRSHPLPDKKTLQDECLDDYPAVVDFHNSIKEGDPPELVRHNLRRAVEELEETWEKYIEEVRGNGSNNKGTTG